MTTFPQMNLSPEATAWGREMQNRIEALTRQTQQLEQASRNQNRALSGTMFNGGSQSFASTGFFGISQAINAFGINSASGSGGPINFTLTEPRLVTASCISKFSFNKTGGTGETGGMAGLIFGLYKDGVGPLSSYGSSSVSTNAGVLGVTSTVSISFSRVLEPGSYELQLGCELHSMYVSGAPTGSISFPTAAGSDNYLFQVTVHGRV